MTSLVFGSRATAAGDFPQGAPVLSKHAVGLREAPNGSELDEEPLVKLTGAEFEAAQG